MRRIKDGIQIIFFVGTAFFFGCQNRNPYDTLVVPLPPIQGQITVTVENGSVPDPGIGVIVYDPAGGSLSKTSSAGSTTAIAGQVVFSETIQGSYRVGLVGQPSSSPSYQSVVLSSASPSKNILLQASGAYLSVTAADSNPQTFPGYVSEHSYNVTYVNRSAYQQDIVFNVDTSNFPEGWNVQIQSAFLHAGQSTIVNVYNGQFSDNASVPLIFNANNGSTVVATTTIDLSKGWTLNLNRCYDFGSGGGCSGISAESKDVNFSYSISGTNYSTDPGSFQLSVFISTCTLSGDSSASCSADALALPAYYTMSNGSTLSGSLGYVPYSTLPGFGYAAANVTGYYTLGGNQYQFNDIAACNQCSGDGYQCY